MKRLIFVVLFALSLSACASVPLKQKATLSLQAAHTAVGAAQDTERSLYAAKAAGLTPSVHLTFADFFIVYFAAEQKTATVLLAWRAGDPVPATLPAAMQALRDSLATADQITDGAAKGSLVAKINDGIGHVQRVLDAVGGTP